MPNPLQPTLNNMADLYTKVGNIFPAIDRNKLEDSVYIAEYSEESIKAFSKFPDELYWFISTVMDIPKKALTEVDGKDLYELFIDAIQKSQILIFKQFVENV